MKEFVENVKILKIKTNIKKIELFVKHVDQMIQNLKYLIIVKMN